MASAGNLLSYGIAVNFFGNYRSEGNAINTLTNKLNSSLLSLQSMILGGGITAGLYKMSNAILSTAKSMEQNFSSLSSVLGSSAKAMETLAWARKKGAETPFEISEVNNAITQMTSLGFNKNDKMRESVFNNIGDFAGLKGRGFDEMVDMVAKAGFGNWERLGDNFGVRKQTIGTQVREQMGRSPEKFKGEEAEINKMIQLVEKGTAGTEDYRMAVVKLIGVLGRGGMEARLKTIAGAWSNVGDIMENFMIDLVGYSQVQGSLANAIKTTITDNILKPFMEVRTVVQDGVEVQVSAISKLSNIGRGVGELLKGVWGMADDMIGGMTGRIVEWIDKLDKYFSDYKNNVAPMILFLYLVKLQVQDFLRGFWAGFEPVFTAFIKLGLGVYKILGSIAEAMGLGSTKAEALGRLLGGIVGLLLGIKAFRIITSPLQPLYNSAVSTYNAISLLKRHIMTTEGWSLGESVQYRWLLFKESVSGLGSKLSGMIAPLWGASAASWSFTASLLANPITWIVIAVIALVAWLAYLIYNWDEVGKSMQGVSDILLTYIAIVMPIVGIPLIMAKYWDDFKNIFYNIWRGIRGYLLGTWLWLNRTVIIPIKTAFINMWTGIKDAASNFINLIFEKFPFIKRLFDGIASVWESIKNAIMWVWDKIANSDFINGILDIVGGVSDWFGDGGDDFLESQQKAMDKKAEEEGGEYKNYYNKFEKMGNYVPEKKDDDPAPKKEPVQHNYSGAQFNVNANNPSEFMKEMENLQGRKGK